MDEVAAVDLIDQARRHEFGEPPRSAEHLDRARHHEAIGQMSRAVAERVNEGAIGTIAQPDNLRVRRESIVDF
jgi:hypothetical protein